MKYKTNLNQLNQFDTFNATKNKMSQQQPLFELKPFPSFNHPSHAHSNLNNHSTIINNLDVISMENVYAQNGQISMRRWMLRSLERDAWILVKFRSNLQQIMFQLSNENYSLNLESTHHSNHSSSSSSSCLLKPGFLMTSTLNPSASASSLLNSTQSLSSMDSLLSDSSVVISHQPLHDQEEDATKECLVQNTSNTSNTSSHGSSSSSSNMPSRSTLSQHATTVWEDVTTNTAMHASLLYDATQLQGTMTTSSMHTLGQTTTNMGHGGGGYSGSGSHSGTGSYNSNNNNNNNNNNSLPSPPGTPLPLLWPFNPLFNCIQTVDHVYLQPGESKCIIIGFCLDRAGWGDGLFASISGAGGIAGTGGITAGAGGITGGITTGTGTTATSSASTTMAQRSSGEVPIISTATSTMTTPQSTVTYRLGREEVGTLVQGSTFNQGEDHDQETFEYFDVHGILFFSAVRVPAPGSGGSGGTGTGGGSGASTSTRAVVPLKDEKMAGSHASLGEEGVGLSHKSPSKEVLMAEAEGTTPSLTTSTSSQGTMTTTTTGNRVDYQTTYKFRARCCKSVLWSDVIDNGIHFDDCIAGEVYFKDFTVWNRSEIELFWYLDAETTLIDPRRFSLTFTDCESGEALDNRPIAGFSYRRIRVTFRPLLIGEFDHEIQLENLNDATHVETVKMVFNVRRVHREEILAFPVGGLLDFGDCYAGAWAKQTLIVQNVSDQTVECQLVAENADCVFDCRGGNGPNAEAETVGEEVESTLSEDNNHPAFENHEARSRNLSAQGSVTSSRDPSPGGVPRSHSESNSVLATEDLPRTLSRMSVLARGGSSSPFNDLADEASLDVNALIMKPGQERPIDVYYRPMRAPSSLDYQALRLRRRQFRIIANYAVVGTQMWEKKKIFCKARVCTSFIEISPRQLNFGDTDVGTLKSSPVKITNLSDLPTRVEIKFASKVLNCYRGEISLRPRQSTEVKIDIYPRKVNPEYRKQITIVNLENRDNDQELEVFSNNIDKNRVTFHSLFYRILTPSSTNFLDCGIVALNNPTLRTFTVENISKKLLKLEIVSSLPEEIQLFIVADDLPCASAPKSTHPSGLPSRPSSSHGRKEQLLAKIEDRVSAVGSRPTESVRSELGASPDYLDLAAPVTSGRFSPRKPMMSKPPKHAVLETALRSFQQTTGVVPTKLFQSNEDSKGGPSFDDPDSATSKEDSHLVDEYGTRGLNIAELLSAFDEESKSGVIFSRPNVEEKFIKSFIHLRNQLEVFIQDKRLIPISSLSVEAESSVNVIMIFTPSGKNRPYIQAKPKKQDAKLFIRLIEFDRNVEGASEFQTLLDAPMSSIPVRELLVRSSLCRSIMDLGQKNINFGLLAKKEKRMKTIVIYNRSEIPLRYYIRKSGSVASGDLHFGEGRMGIIRGFGKREVEFLFQPSLPGSFMEKIVIENICDKSNDNDQVVFVKAQIRKPSNFFLKSLNIDFGPILADDPTPINGSVIITNMTNQSRIFECRFEPKELIFDNSSLELNLEMVNNSKSAAGMLSKDDEEEVEQLEQKLKIARRKGRPEKVKKIEDRLSQLRQSVKSAATDLKIRKTSHSISFTLEAKKTTTVHVFLRALRRDAKDSVPVSAETCEGKLYVYEQKNMDAVKTVAYSAAVCFDQKAFADATIATPNIASKTQFELSDLISRPSSPASSRRPSLGEETLTPTVSLSDLHSSKAPKAALFPSSLVIDRCEMNKLHFCSFILRNTDESQALRYSLSLKKPSTLLNIRSALEGSVPAYGSKRIDFTVKVTDFRKHAHVILIKDLNNDSLMSFTLTIHPLQEQFLDFFDLYKPSDIGQNLVLNLGDCYLDNQKKFSKSVPLRIRNISRRNIVIAAQSNLTQQVFVFANASLDAPAVNIPLLSGEACTFYVAIQPNLPAKELISGECRDLVGGIKFLVRLPENPLSPEDLKTEANLLGSEILRFKARIGRISAEIKPNYINFGESSDVTKVYEGRILIRNLSSQLSLRYDTKIPASCRVVAQTSNILASRSDNSKKSEIEITFSFRPQRYGFFSEVIRFYNADSGSQIGQVQVCCFINPGMLSIVTGQRENYLKWQTLYVTCQKESFKLSETQEASDAKVITVENNQQFAQTLVFKSDLDIRVSVPEQNVLNVPYMKLSNFGGIQLEPCSQVFRLGPAEKLQIRLSDPLPSPNLFSTSVLASLKQGKIQTISGILLIENVKRRIDVQVLRLSCDFGCSIGIIEPSIIDIGRVRCLNNQEQLGFSFTVRNLADLPLFYDIDRDSFFEIVSIKNDTGLDLLSGPRRQKAICVPPSSSTAVQAVLIPSKLEQSINDTQTLFLPIKNINNPENRLKVALKVCLIRSPFSYSRLNAGEVVLPAIVYPQPLNATPCDTWFSILNTSDNDVKFEIGVDMAPEVNEFVAVEVLSRFSNSILKGSVTLAAKASLDVKIRASVKAENRRLNEVSANLTNPDGITFGQLWVVFKNDGFASDVRDDIPLRGIILEGPSFEISEKRIEFHVLVNDEESDYEDTRTAQSQKLDRPKQTRSLIITNLSPAFPLRMKAYLEMPLDIPMEFINITPLDSDGCITINPAERYPLSINLVNQSISFSNDLKLILEDVQSSSKFSRTVIISVISDDYRMSPKKPASTIPVENETTPSTFHPVSTITSPALYEASFKKPAGPLINLRGCKRISPSVSGRISDDPRFELDMGQQDLSSNAVTRKIILENENTVPVRYKIRLSQISSSEKPWIVLNRTEGVLEPRPRINPIDSDSSVISSPIMMGASAPASRGENSHVLLLTLHPTVRNIYTAYIIIENLDNPLDIKYIRVVMEVVSQQKSQGADVFSVVLNGVDPSLDHVVMDSLVYNFEYSSRSLFIHNHEKIPMEFSLKVKNPPNDDSELLLSLSRNTARLFKTLTIDAESSARIYLRLRPRPSSIRTENIGQAEMKEFEISVNCRLVKDYQKTVYLRAYCSAPTLSVSAQELRFTGTIVKNDFSDQQPAEMPAAVNEWSSSISPEVSQVLIVNLTDSDLSLMLMNDTMYFLVDKFSASNDNVLTLGKQGSTHLMIRPNFDVIAKNGHRLRKEKYIQEQMVIYNYQRPTERYWLVLQLNLGSVQSFYLPPTTKSSYLYEKLEKNIVSFLKNFRLVATRALPQLKSPVDGISDQSSEDFHLQQLKHSVLFEFNYVVDQLVYSGTKEHSGEPYYQLALLLFSSLFNEPCFNDGGPIEQLGRQQWTFDLAFYVRGLLYFLSCFPLQNSYLVALRRLHQKLITPS